MSDNRPIEWVLKKGPIEWVLKKGPVEWVLKKGPIEWVLKKDQLNGFSEKWFQDQLNGLPKKDQMNVAGSPASLPPPSLAFH